MYSHVRSQEDTGMHVTAGLSITPTGNNSKSSNSRGDKPVVACSPNEILYSKENEPAIETYNIDVVTMVRPLSPSCFSFF